MKITKSWLEDQSACHEGIAWFEKQRERDGVALVKKLIGKRIEWANWLVVSLMDKTQKVRYSIFAAEQGLHSTAVNAAANAADIAAYAAAWEKK